MTAVIVTSGMTVVRINGELRRSLHELAVTLDSIGDGVIATDAQGNIVRMNPAAENLIGRRIEESRGAPLEKVFRVQTGQAGERSSASNQNCGIDSKCVDFGLEPYSRLIARSGAAYQIHEKRSPIMEVDGRKIGTVVVFRDMTRENEARALLYKTQKRFRSFVENANDIVYSLTPEGIFSYVSPNWLEFMGEPACEAVGRNYSKYVHPDDLHLCVEFLQSVLSRGERGASVQYRVYRADGKTRWHMSRGGPLTDERGVVTGYIGIARDMTESKRIEEALRESQMRYIEATRAGKITVWEWDAARNRFFHDPVFWENLGYSERDVDQRPDLWRTVIHPDDRETIDFEIQRCLAGESISLNLEHRLVGDNGDLRWAYVRGETYGDGRRMVGTVQDITDKKKMQEANKKLEAQYRQSQRLESVGRLAGGVSHDLNNLLTPILGYGEILLLDIDEHDRRRAAVESIVQAGLRAKDLVNQLLAFSRKQVLSFQPLDLNDVVNRFEKLIRRTIRENITIRVVSKVSLPPIEGDRGRLEQVLMNLAVNAQDAMPDGGELIIETGVAQLDTAFTAKHSGLVPGRYVMLGVSDTGMGMDEETRENIFEPFFSTKGEHGAGLGLATSYGVVKQHKGVVFVYSEPGKGSTFKIYFPVSAKNRVRFEKAVAPPRNLHGTETVLLAEDDPHVRELSASLLERFGYTVLPAKSGEHAMTIFRNQNGKVDILLTDVIMPDMNGRELASMAMARQPDLKVLYMSGYTDNVIARHGVLEEGVAFIQKPFTIHTLADKVREILDGAPPSENL